ncbi:MAG: hypothetical protein GY859_41040 [Desulfobacterales bacterium]|nr:hypothetical protein [Desulfobacterales bacterium]
MKNVTGYIFIFLLIIVAGCAPSSISVNEVHTSSPAIQTVSNAQYEARLEPLKRDKNFFVAFRLSVSNKTGGDLEIDWNKTRWLHDGRNLGGLVFKGIDPGAFKDSTVPSDFIPAGETFSKEIMPYKLVTWAPIRDQNLSPGQRGISPGMIPPGENGIILVVRQDGKPVLEEITLEIKAEKAD